MARVQLIREGLGHNANGRLLLVMSYDPALSTEYFADFANALSQDLCPKGKNATIVH